jgi:hypothetical protein
MRMSFLTLRDIIAEVPGSEISKPAGDFAVRMIEINAKRILQTDI